MRYRRVKETTEKLERLSRFITSEAADKKGRWNEVFGNDKPVYLELGCGKGKFLMEMAARHPENNYIGVEGQEPVLLRAAQRACQVELNNITFVCEFFRNPSDYFEKDEVSGIFLNFSDPWPKARHAKRRLTHTRFLTEYRKFLKPDGVIQFKTDNDPLFDFSVDEFQANGYSIFELSYDLHHSPMKAKEVTTEYEDKFTLWGKSIKYLKAGL